MFPNLHELSKNEAIQSNSVQVCASPCKIRAKQAQVELILQPYVDLSRLYVADLYYQDLTSDYNIPCSPSTCARQPLLCLYLLLGKSASKSLPTPTPKVIHAVVTALHSNLKPVCGLDKNFHLPDCPESL